MLYLKNLEHYIFSVETKSDALIFNQYCYNAAGVQKQCDHFQTIIIQLSNKLMNLVHKGLNVVRLQSISDIINVFLRLNMVVYSYETSVCRKSLFSDTSFLCELCQKSSLFNFFFLFGTKFIARLFTFSSYILHSFICREYIQSLR